MAPSADLESENSFSKKILKLEAFFERVFAPIEVVTGPFKNEGIRDGDPLRGTL